MRLVNFLDGFSELLTIFRLKQIRSRPMIDHVLACDYLKLDHVLACDYVELDHVLASDFLFLRVQSVVANGKSVDVRCHKHYM